MNKLKATATKEATSCTRTDETTPVGSSIVINTETDTGKSEIVHAKVAALENVKAITKAARIKLVKGKK